MPTFYRRTGDYFVVIRSPNLSTLTELAGETDRCQTKLSYTTSQKTVVQLTSSTFRQCQVTGLCKHNHAAQLPRKNSLQNTYLYGEEYFGVHAWGITQRHHSNTHDFEYQLYLASIKTNVTSSTILRVVLEIHFPPLIFFVFERRCPY